ncbi:MAG TPA: anhydro-N-acetylmuramic acid kinase [Cellvibrio sp.]|nr:anhydro-N-acetylmuramic acid kinase [Cellvibrio sp.]
MPDRQLYIGLMSGTSADGIDAVLVDMQETPQLLATHSQRFTNHFRDQIHAICLPGHNEIDRMGSIDGDLGKLFADCSLNLLKKAGVASYDVIAIGSHGQTIRHRPPESKDGRFTLQIGDPNVIAELTGITTIADFRRRDMAAGGQGAPLVPAFHQAVFHSLDKDKAVVNIGGMANITWLPASGDIRGFDTGPGNALMDAWINKHHGQTYDDNGNWAASGKIISELVESLLSDAFFTRPFPKSTGREHFNIEWLQKHIDHLLLKPSAEDVQATLLELTAKSIADSIELLNGSTSEVLICGGGAFNSFLLQRLSHLLPNASIGTTENYGVAPQWVEAMAFAWLAYQTINHHPGNLCAVTGAKREVILGGVYYAK